MPTPPKGPRLGGGPAHERLILANLATALFEHDRITTTATKAKRLRPLAERLITFAKRGDLHARRQVMTVVRDKGVIHRLFTEIAPDVAQRPGGYTRITKIAPRKGDNAPMAVIELIREPFSPKQATVEEAQAAARRAASASTVPAAPIQDPGQHPGQDLEQEPSAAGESDTAQSSAMEDAVGEPGAVEDPAQELSAAGDPAQDTLIAEGPALDENAHQEPTASQTGEGEPEQRS